MERLKFITPRESILRDAIKEFPGIKRTAYEYDFDTEWNTILQLGKMRSEDFVIDEHCRDAYENILKWCFCDETAKAMNPITKEWIPANMKLGWWIAGNPGSGKSWCLEIFKQYCFSSHLKCTFGKDDKKVYLSWKNFHADELVDDYIKTGQCVQKGWSMVGIQDVGTERKEAVHMGNRIPLIRTILEERGDRPDCMTMVTSNYSIYYSDDEKHPIKKMYGDRVASRLLQMFNYIEIKGLDRRERRNK